MKYYAKALGINRDGELVSCHGGQATWKIGQTVTPREPDAGLCRAGRIHVLRLRDLPAWLGTQLAIVSVQSDDILEGPDKVGVLDATPVRVHDSLDIIVRFAEWCAENATSYSDEKASAWLVAQYPAGFFDGVEA